MLSVQDVFVSARGSKQRKAEILEVLGEFAVKEGDHLTLLAIYNDYTSHDRSDQWCRENFLNARAMRRADEIRQQLKRYVKRYSRGCPLESNFESIRKCIVSGFFSNAAKLDSSGQYRTVKDRIVVQIHPSSIYSTLGNLPTWIIYHELVLVETRQIRDLCSVDPRWLLELAPEYYATRDTQVSGSSGDVGLPKNALSSSAKTVPVGKIMFKKPQRTEKRPMHIGKRKGGLRSQF